MEDLPVPPVGMVLLARAEKGSPFERKIVALLHRRGTHATGLILNQPLHLMLSDFEKNADASSENIPVYCGGPVQPRKLIITGLEFDTDRRRLHWHFDLDMHRLSQCVEEHPKMSFKAYRGYVTWEDEQLIDEMKNKRWLPTPYPFKPVFASDQPRLWETLMLQFYPFAPGVPYVPENPGRN